LEKSEFKTDIDYIKILDNCYESGMMIDKNKIIDYNTYYDNFSDEEFQQYQDTLYDLILEDMVEKVEGK
jgi:hypothetical protein